MQTFETLPMALPRSAADHARRMAAWQTHAFIFLMITSVLAVLDWYTGAPYWVGWVVLGWGSGLLAHYLRARR